MSKSIRKNLRAFTLVEMMLAMAIVAIMIAAILMSLGSGRTRKELETNAHEFAATVRAAQNYALSGMQTVSGTDPCGLRITWGGSGYDMIYMYKNSAGTACDQTPPSPIASYVLKNGVIFSNAGSFYFTPPFGRIFNNTGLLSSGSIPITFTKAGISSVVCVFADGRVLGRIGAATCVTPPPMSPVI